MSDSIQPDDLHFMDMALDLARQAMDQDEVPVGAIAVSRGEVVGLGSNCVVRTADPTAHAEICALRAAAREAGNYRLRATTLYVTLEPCPMCAGAMVHARVDRLVFGAHDPKTGAAESLYRLTGDPRLNHQVCVVGGVRAAESARLLRNFFALRRQQGPVTSADWSL